ncbi:MULTISPECIES: hypothetical protein [unclassified Gemella]|uniref:hypothetical protein n=1 Tax=unclassified Gemella TaxID=2624949 RepID=UPI001C03C83B|nr:MULTISPECIES: hypothetical protein [unclassified Gemella]MBU0278778.1 hypothetical protein [Gemella sp. zg-1178]QWQ38716.1 hypothetical protein KMP11_07175 [Gemella sp. zg-570]
MTILEPTIHAAKITYQVEAMRLVNSNKKVIVNFLDLQKKLGFFPKELEYISSFYDSKTGSSGSFFEDRKRNNYILAYTGTNPYTDFQKDFETDLYSIALGQGRHYRACINFYKKVRDRYGDNIILTGHSLGGNIVQRVAVEFNVKRSVIYNSAPLYIENGVELFMDVSPENKNLYLKRLRRYKKNKLAIESKIADFSGEILHFSSQDDILNRIMAVLKDETVYCCKNYILKNAGKHSLKAMITNSQQLICNIIEGKEYEISALAENYSLPSKLETKSMLQVASNGDLSLEYFASMFIGSSGVLNLVGTIGQDVDISKFIRYLLSKIE